MKAILIAGLLISPLTVFAAPAPSQNAHVIQTPATPPGGPAFRSVQRHTEPTPRPQARMLNQRVSPPPAPVIIHHYPPVTPHHQPHRPRSHNHTHLHISGGSGDYAFSIEVKPQGHFRP